MSKRTSYYNVISNFSVAACLSGTGIRYVPIIIQTNRRFLTYKTPPDSLSTDNYVFVYKKRVATALQKKITKYFNFIASRKRRKLEEKLCFIFNIAKRKKNEDHSEPEIVGDAF